MSKNVFILGAGASRHTGAPMMNDFMDAIEDKCNSHDGAKFLPVLTKLRELKAIHTKAKIDFNNNLETAMVICKMDNLLRPFKENEVLLNQFKSIICTILEEKIKFKLKTDSHNGSVNSEYGQLIELIRAMNLNQTTVITFNYDIALDYAFYIHGVDINYCITPDGNSSTFKLLKLHGSTNWKKGNLSNTLEPISIKDYLNKKGTWVRRDDQPLPISQSFSSSETAFIVPPTWNKAWHYQQINSVWQQAAKELSTAENIFICGYSFPSTDEFFKYLYAIGTIGSTRIRNFSVFNPDENVEARFSTLMGTEVQPKFRFIKKNFAEALKDIRMSFITQSGK